VTKFPKSSKKLTERSVSQLTIEKGQLTMKKIKDKRIKIKEKKQETRVKKQVEVEKVDLPAGADESGLPDGRK
jgi:hypothetical protein